MPIDHGGFGKSVDIDSFRGPSHLVAGDARADPVITIEDAEVGVLSNDASGAEYTHSRVNAPTIARAQKPHDWSDS